VWRRAWFVLQQCASGGVPSQLLMLRAAGDVEPLAAFSLEPALLGSLPGGEVRVCVCSVLIAPE
jgi:hypothetical protein